MINYRDETTMLSRSYCDPFGRFLMLLDYNADEFFVSHIFFNIVSGVFYLQGYAAREFAKQGVKPGELAITSNEAVRSFNDIVAVSALSLYCSHCRLA